MKQQTSAIVRLQSLPPVFRGADLTVRFGWTSKTASQYLYLWKKRGLVQGLGGHSDVFANLLTAPTPDWEKALLMAMPSAVLVGIEVLRRAGWTTQIPRCPDVAVAARDRCFSVHPFTVEYRAAGWFEIVRPGIGRAAGLPMLRPAWALADMLRARGWGKCGLHPDDIDWDMAGTRDVADWRVARAALGVEECPSMEDPHRHGDAASDIEPARAR
jgi:hypothetical protein